MHGKKTLIARHPNRFSTLDFIKNATTDFLELHGDRSFSDDKSIVGGIGKIDNIPFAIIGHQKGKNTKENVYRNFGMPKPEGYRKALRIMKIAEKFRIPIISFVDTPGAFPGMDAEERNQSEAIAKNLYEMGNLETMNICVVLGEGGSGGALALAVCNLVIMMEHSIYSVISPEGCSSILWKNASKSKEIANSLCYTAQDLLRLGAIQEIIPEPLGGTHNNIKETAESIKKVILKNYNQLKDLDKETILKNRYKKFQKIGTNYIKIS